MKWLEQHGADDTEKWLGEALKAARQRTGDEVARRRVWARIEGLLSGQEGADIFLDGLLSKVCGDRVIGGVVVRINHKSRCLYPTKQAMCQKPKTVKQWGKCPRAPRQAGIYCQPHSGERKECSF